uniref:Ribosomal protein S14 n=1 Tax=Cyanoptyche gloeocystis TaxID=77922 RepID=A0A096Y6W1_9EUKA|nr:ribosomal protein S14 [Cyanoptyche gloeocystis]AIM52075.1 ribosomal protein S14 [Cyanoptyche gloeocystis]
MKFKHIINKKYRAIYNIYEIKINIIKSIMNNQKICYIDKYIILRNLKIKSNLKQKYILKTKIRNRCIITNRSKGIVNLLRISRITLRELVSNGFIANFLKSSW